MAIIAIMLAIIVPSVSRIDSGRQVTLAAYNIQGFLDTARAYAKANSTYTWVGFYEEDGSMASTVPPTDGTGRVVVSVVASKDATAMYPVNGDQVALSGTNLVQIGNLLKLNNIHLDDFSKNNVPARVVVTDTNYQVGSNDFKSHVSASGGASGSNKVTFTFPVSTATPKYTFQKIIQFSPLGDATKIVESPTPLIELGLRPARGSVVDANSKIIAAVQVSGISGTVRIYRP